MPELWADFSDSGLPQGRAGHERASRFHGDDEMCNRAAPLSARPGKVVLLGAEKGVIIGGTSVKSWLKWNSSRPEEAEKQEKKAGEGVTPEY